MIDEKVLSLSESDLIRRYYAESTNLWLPPRSSFRQFRFFLKAENGNVRVVKIKDRITSITTLRRWLVRFAPLHAYYTTATWLDPQNLGPKDLRENSPGFQFSYNVFLSQELYFDVDVAGSLEEAKKWTLKLKECLEEEYSFRSILCVYSGNKGFHLHVYDFDLSKWIPRVSPLPTMRELQTQEAKVRIVNDLMERGLVFDADVTIDTRRIIRLPGTINGKTLNISETVDDIKTFQPQRLGNEDEKLGA
jgi:DNA primase catalytic subunit